jgi:hypothetical protein
MIAPLPNRLKTKQLRSPLLRKATTSFWLRPACGLNLALRATLACADAIAFASQSHHLILASAGLRP